MTDALLVPDPQSTAGPARFFHGTLADLTSGEVLVPGAEIGLTNHGISRHVYAVTTDFDAVADLGWLPEHDTADNRLSYAIDTAEEWGSYAADGACTDARHTDPYECTCPTEDNTCVCERPPSEFHAESQREGMLPGCIRVYEVEPLGPIEPDPSSDVDAGVRMARARVIRRITAADKPLFDAGDNFPA